MKLTPTMKHELHMSYLGGGGMYVNTRHPVLQTYDGLERRGLMRHTPEGDSEGSRYFTLTDEGRSYAVELAARKDAE